MSSAAPRLALGTVQFGLPYGIAGRAEPVPESEVRAILEMAYANGIRVLDTAAAYGDIEQRLARLCHGLPFKIVSKVPPVPAELPEQAAVQFVSEAIQRSRACLGDLLTALLFHKAEDLLGSTAQAIWNTAAEEADTAGLRFGVSCYGPQELQAVRVRFPVTVAQLPGNVFDQRVAVAAAAGGLDDVEVHLRSVFLQGMLLMQREEALNRVPAAQEPMTRWLRWCDEQGLSPLQAALAVAKGMPGVQYLVLGIDSPAQLQQILAAWNAVQPVGAPQLACDSAELIDPRRWKAA